MTVYASNKSNNALRNRHNLANSPFESVSDIGLDSDIVDSIYCFFIALKPAQKAENKVICYIIDTVKVYADHFVL